MSLVKSRVFVDLPCSITDIMPPAPTVCGDRAKRSTKVTDVGAHDSVAYCKRLGTESMGRAFCKLAKDSILRTEAFGATKSQRYCMLFSAGFGAGCEVKSRCALCTFTVSPRRESTWPRAECAPSFRWRRAQRVELFSS